MLGQRLYYVAGRLSALPINDKLDIEIILVVKHLILLNEALGIGISTLFNSLHYFKRVSTLVFIMAPIFDTSTGTDLLSAGTLVGV